MLKKITVRLELHEKMKRISKKKGLTQGAYLDSLILKDKDK